MERLDRLYEGVRRRLRSRFRRFSLYWGLERTASLRILDRNVGKVKRIHHVRQEVVDGLIGGWECVLLLVDCWRFKAHFEVFVIPNFLFDMVSSP